jgi:hypothetical protein
MMKPDRLLNLQPNERREKAIRELFRRARATFPNWPHTSLMRWIWPRRPYGTNFNEMARIAREFEKPGS